MELDETAQPPTVAEAIEAVARCADAIHGNEAEWLSREIVGLRPLFRRALEDQTEFDWIWCVRKLYKAAKYLVEEPEIMVRFYWPFRDGGDLGPSAVSVLERLLSAAEEIDAATMASFRVALARYRDKENHDRSNANPSFPGPEAATAPQPPRERLPAGRSRFFGYRLEVLIEDRPDLVTPCAEIAPELEARLRRVKSLLDWKGAKGSARKWWMAFEAENLHNLSLVVRSAEEIAVRGATIEEFFQAYVYSSTSGIQANIHFLEYMRLRREDARANLIASTLGWADSWEAHERNFLHLLAWYRARPEARERVLDSLAMGAVHEIVRGRSVDLAVLAGRCAIVTNQRVTVLEVIGRILGVIRSLEDSAPGPTSNLLARIRADFEQK